MLTVPASGSSPHFSVWGLIAAACGGTSTDATTDRDTSGSARSAIDTLAEALGDIESTSSYNYLASGSRHEPGQGLKLGDVVDVSEFDVSVATDLSGGRLRLDWVRTMGERTVVPDAEPAYVEVVTVDAGYIDGNDAVFEIGSSRPMNSARLAAVQRQQLVLQPHVALARALNEGHEIEFTAPDIIEIDDPGARCSSTSTPSPGTLFGCPPTRAIR